MNNSVKNRSGKTAKVFTEYVAENRLWYVLVSAAVILGVVLGAVSAAMMSDGSHESLNEYMRRFVSAYSLQPVSRAEVFRVSAFGSIKLALVIWLTGFWTGMIPFAVLNMGIKGYGIGFTAAFLVQAYRGKGVLFALLSLMPKAVILLPAAVVYTVFCIRYAISRRGENVGTMSVRRAMYARSAVCLIMAASAFILCSLVDGFVVPTVLKPVCSLINV